MSAYDQAHKAYIDAQKNHFYDAWGIVASPETIYKLRAECMEKLTVLTAGDHLLERLFGLVVIPCDCCEKDKMYIVDEQLGRTILGTEKGVSSDKNRYP